MATIAWDVDDVLNNLMQEWFFTEWKIKHPQCQADIEDLLENPPHKILGVREDEYLESLDSFRVSTGYPRMSPVDKVLQWFMQHGHKHRHIAVTSVPHAFAPTSAEWVLHHFGAWIRTFHFVPSPRNGDALPRYDTGKGDFLRWIQKVDLIVDDNEENVAEAISTGVKGLVFPRPWNASRNVPVEKILAGLSSLP